MFFCLSSSLSLPHFLALPQVKSDAVKQELDRHEDMLRSCLRAVDAVAAIPGSGNCAAFKVRATERSESQRPWGGRRACAVKDGSRIMPPNLMTTNPSPGYNMHVKSLCPSPEL